MEPSLPAPRIPEVDHNGQSSEITPPPFIPNAETNPNTGVEQPHEVAPQASPAAGSVVQPTVVAPAQAAQQPVDATPVASTTDDGNPALADDVDVIEKEWVDRAKKIVSATRADPHRQEKEVSKLQADYLLKRYGKQVKLTE